MKKRRFTWLVILLAVGIGAGLVVPAWRWQIIGWARSESFFRGKPTSYWSEEAKNWRLLDSCQGSFWCRETTDFPPWVKQIQEKLRLVFDREDADSEESKSEEPE